MASPNTMDLFPVSAAPADAPLPLGPTRQRRPARALTLSRPWPWAILELPGPIAKRVENRSWWPPESQLVPGERFALHAGLSWDKDAPEFIDDIVRELCSGKHPFPDPCPPKKRQHVGGAVVGVATLLRVVDRAVPTCEIPNCDIEGDHDDPMAESLWFFGEFGWVLHDLTPLARPVPATGHLGLWVMPKDVWTAVVAQAGPIP